MPYAQRISFAISALPFRWYNGNLNVWAMRRVDERALGGGGGRAPRTLLPRRPAEPGARPLRIVPFGLGRKRVHTARPQGALRGRDRRRHPLGRGREAGRPAARSARP